MEVTSPKSFWAMLIMNFGLIFALGLLAWRLAQPKLNFLNQGQMITAWVLLGLLYAFQSYKAWQVNKDLLNGTKSFTPSQRYQFRQVALLEYAYVITFGSELAAVSMLPAFFEYTFSLDHVTASMIAASYPFLNLFSRPSGGLISDKFGSRKWTMTIIAAGVGISYLIASGINQNWPLFGAIAATMLSAYFAQAGCGATYGIVPLIKKEITGQISGNVGAYGNFGGVVFLTIYSLTNAATLFAVMGIAGLICAFLCVFFLKEPRDSFAADYATEPEHAETPQINVVQDSRN
jgi:NNP family nitrate/nitrite transporter-like MFS transporter